MVLLVEEAARAQTARMIRFASALFGTLALSACVSANGSAQGAYQVSLEDNYLWPVEMAGHPEVDVMPYVPALVVTRRDGQALTEADEAAARAAALAHCAALGEDGPRGAARFAEGAWAFSTC